MTDVQALITLISTFITAMVGMLGLFVRSALRNQQELINDLREENTNLRSQERQQHGLVIKMQEENNKKEKAKQKLINDLEVENEKLKRIVQKLVKELESLSPGRTKLMGITGVFGID